LNWLKLLKLLSFVKEADLDAIVGSSEEVKVVPTLSEKELL
jgi:hypothetical protein